ncbi:MAG: hypothetical protein H7841_07845 [Magnetospirillum sp. WYHS-4]
MRRHPGILLVAAGLIALAADAWAGGKDEGEIRSITATTATSDCIGDPRTPVCAVETLLACLARSSPDLCTMVGEDVPRTHKEPEGMRYRIERSCYFRPGIPPGGNDLHADVAVRVFGEGDAAEHLYYHTARATRNGWIVNFRGIEGEVGPVRMTCTPAPPPFGIPLPSTQDR